jgi:D-glycero-D-manno-heptose 1,7-bisphosphate phosphatase
MKINKAIFLDRDGVINEAVMRNNLPASPRKLEEFKFLPEVAAVLEEFKSLGFLNIIVSNQPDVSRGLMEAKDLEKMNELMKERLKIDEIRNCTHDNKDNCNCRKPKPGMMLEAAAKWSIDLEKSFLIGDSWKDMEAGQAAGCKTFLIRRNYNNSLKNGYDFEVNNLKKALQIIKN